MEPLFIVVALLVLAAPSYQLMDKLDDILVYAVETPTNIRKRAVTSKTSDSFDDFVEDKLVQHTQALEQLVRMVQTQGEVTKQLVENMSKHVDKPILPTTVEFNRRSMGGKVETVSTIKPVTKNPWCTLALLCKRTISPVCGFDDNFGYGKFEDMCHMFQVNCYWKYNFSAVATCRPKF